MRRWELAIACGYGDPPSYDRAYRPTRRGKASIIDKLAGLLPLGDFLALLNSLRKAG